MFGNGLKPTVWKAFRERFGIKVIREFYGSTEGNTNVGKLMSGYILINSVCLTLLSNNFIFN